MYQESSKITPYIDQGKEDTLAQRAVDLLHQVQRKLTWVWWVSGSTLEDAADVSQQRHMSFVRW